MAMNGINMPLSFTGQEYVWQKLYSTIGLTDKEIKSYFSGPAFLAWQRMGNLRGWVSEVKLVGVMLDGFIPFYYIYSSETREREQGQ